MSPPDKCTGCGRDTLSPWSFGQNRRRCILCGYEEDRPVEKSAESAIIKGE